MGGRKEGEGGKVEILDEMRDEEGKVEANSNACL